VDGQQLSWEASCSICANLVPGEITISLWLSTARLRKDVCCGSLTLPRAETMCNIIEEDFQLPGRAEFTGSVCLSLVVLEASAGSKGSGITIGRSALRLVAPTQLSKPQISFHRPAVPKADTHEPDSPARTPALLLWRRTSAENTAQEKAPALLSKPQISFQRPAMPKADAQEPESPPRTPALLLGRRTSVDHATKEEEAAAGRAGPEILVGRWRCTATEGLEEFLRATGAGVIQRKIAISAKWPEWELTVDTGRVVLVNHSQLGTLIEEIPLALTPYSHKDARGNVQTCKAMWEGSLKRRGGEDSGRLTIWKISELGSWREERSVRGDTLNFKLIKDDCSVSWGRTFVRA